MAVTDVLMDAVLRLYAAGRYTDECTLSGSKYVLMELDGVARRHLRRAVERVAPEEAAAVERLRGAVLILRKDEDEVLFFDRFTKAEKAYGDAIESAQRGR